MRRRVEVMADVNDAPAELQVTIREFFPPEEWTNAANIALLESGWNAFALNDSTGPHVPCGTVIGQRGGVKITAERSVGYFQINSCNYPDWEWQRLYNARHNVGTAHMIWESQGWGAWHFSALELGLI
jgi:hypothetical protein